MKKRYIKHHADGSLWAKGYLENNAMEGRWEWFRKDGTKMRAGFFKQGKQTGKWVTYHKNGSVVKTTDFDK